jgi:2-oxoglutarate ferredoxin oxidoreductase subunit delta
MPRVVFREERCKGCLLCTVVCPKNIIVGSGRFNAQGYKVAEIPADKAPDCTGCASCAKICPDFAIRVFVEDKPAKGAAKAAPAKPAPKAKPAPAAKATPAAKPAKPAAKPKAKSPAKPKAQSAPRKKG